MILKSWKFLLIRSFRLKNGWTWSFLGTGMITAGLTLAWLKAGILLTKVPGNAGSPVIWIGILLVIGFLAKTMRRWSGLRLEMMLQSGFEKELLRHSLFKNNHAEHQITRYRALWFYSDIPFRINLLACNLMSGTLSLTILLTQEILSNPFIPVALLLYSMSELFLFHCLARKEHMLELSQSGAMRDLSENRLQAVKEGAPLPSVRRIWLGQAKLNQELIRFENGRRQLAFRFRVVQLSILICFLLVTGTLDSTVQELTVLAIAAWRAWKALSELLPAFSAWLRLNPLVIECYQVLQFNLNDSSSQLYSRSLLSATTAGGRPSQKRTSTR